LKFKKCKYRIVKVASLNKYIVEYRFSWFGTWHSVARDSDIVDAIERGYNISSARPRMFDSAQDAIAYVEEVKSNSTQNDQVVWFD
jgi:hypothetical protein